MHSRKLDSVCDWFIQGQSIYDIDESGNIVVRPYGAATEWKVMQYTSMSTFAFLGRGVTYIRHDDTLMCIADMLGRELRNSKGVLFNGRKTKTSNSVEHYTNVFSTGVGLMPHQHRCANFYFGSQAKLAMLKNMHVLGSGEYSKSLDSCNDFELYNGGRALCTHLHQVMGSKESSQMLGASYHMGADESTDQITHYQGHLDKAFVCSGWFIPLGVSFFTFVAFPTAWHYQQDERSKAKYDHWICTLKEDEKKRMEKFLTAFQKDAEKPMKDVDFQIYIFENKIGSLLAFPTNICYHTTVTPTTNVPRDVLIMHPLMGDKLL